MQKFSGFGLWILVATLACMPSKSFALIQGPTTCTTGYTSTNGGALDSTTMCDHEMYDTGGGGGGAAWDATPWLDYNCSTDDVSRGNYANAYFKNVIWPARLAPRLTPDLKEYTIIYPDLSTEKVKWANMIQASDSVTLVPNSCRPPRQF